jgi:hypothetical protein
MRERFFFFSATTRDKGYSPSPTGTWKFNLLSTKQGVYCDCSLNHSTSLQPPFISLIRKHFPTVPVPRTICFLNSLQNQRASHALPLQKWSPDPFMCILFPLPMIFLYFLAFYNKISWVHFPIHGSDQKVSRWGTLPISSLTLEEDFPTTNLTGN